MEIPILETERLRLRGLDRYEEESAPPQDHHPDPDHLERFVRGELSRTERRTVVRHLLRGCAECKLITARVWYLGHTPRQGLRLIMEDR